MPEIAIKENTIKQICFHCGEICQSNSYVKDDHHFCCNGCKTVFELLSENGLENYYLFDKSPGVTVISGPRRSHYKYLDEEKIRQGLLSFSSPNHSAVRLMLPTIHCSSCIWLLENLHTLNKGILNVSVNFSEKIAKIDFDPKSIALSELAETLQMIGYPPSLEWNKNKKPSKSNHEKQTALKIGIAGFCFGNIMLLSFPEYLGFTGVNNQQLKLLFSYLSMLLALPIVFYCSQHYFRSALKSLRAGFLNIDVPISLGIATLFLRSVYEVVFTVGNGYFDSLAGLLFFLLIGKWLQERTYSGLSFERDYKSYFPISVYKIDESEVQSAIPLEQIEIGDRLFIRNQELIPADARLLSDTASIDYGFVTGEAIPVNLMKGDQLYAGGRLLGKGIQIIIERRVAQSYLTELWNNKAFRKNGNHLSGKLINKVSRYFTLVIISLALLAAAYWLMVDSSKMWAVVTSILIVACPCALALSVPFTLSNAMFVLGKINCFVKNTDVIEDLYDVDTIVFDKTGTITEDSANGVKFVGSNLTKKELQGVLTLANNSSHPISRLIVSHLQVTINPLSDRLSGYCEQQGSGIEAIFENNTFRLGSINWVKDKLAIKDEGSNRTFLSINGEYRGYFDFGVKYRKGLKQLIDSLSTKYQLFILSGDNDKERNALSKLNIPIECMRFHQSPHDKLAFVEELQKNGKNIMMIGDGLNDAGALKQSDVGVAVTNDCNAFTPASDVIMLGNKLMDILWILKLARFARFIIIGCFILSFLYNIIGLSFAVTGNLSPVLAAILMPVSSISVLLMATASIKIFAYIKHRTS